nr:movement protein [Citrus virus A]
MFKKMFRRASGTPKPVLQQATLQNRPQRQDTDSNVSRAGKNELVADESLKTADRNLYKFDLPNNEQGFDDLAKEYSEGTRFQYVALSGKDEESYSARIRRLVTLTPRMNKDTLPLTKIPQLKLIEDTEQFNLSLAVPKKGKPYIRLASVTAYYCPLVSSFSEFTKAGMSLHDSRLLSDTSVQSVTFNSNITQKLELSLDYCIPRSSASKITLNIAREQKFLKEGEEWGAVQLLIKLEESDFPYCSNLKEATAVMALPPAVLDSHNVNPNHIDTTIVETQRRKVREMYENGDISNENEPIKEILGKVSYAKSSISAKVKGQKTNKKFGKGWEHMEFRVPKITKDQESEEPEEDGSIATPSLGSGRNSVQEIEEIVGTSETKKVNFNKGVKFNEFGV